MANPQKKGYVFCRHDGAIRVRVRVRVVVPTTRLLFSIGVITIALMTLLAIH